MATDPLIGRKLGDYTIQSLLGQGGMARVYQGYDENLDRYAAIKVIESNLVASDEVEEYRERFQREARAIAKLNHPRVVNVYQYGQQAEQNLYYMAMGFVEGRDLRHILKDLNREGKYLSYAQIMRIIRDTAEALDYSHAQGVIHRDIKPSNIMLTPDGHAVLTDFGLALNAQEGTIGNTFGSVHYIAPEQAVNSAEAVPQSDLYSLGVVLYEMLTGRVPFEDASAMSVALKHISDPPPLPSSLNARISQAVEDVVIKCLQKEPGQRYANGLALVHALQAAFSADDGDDTHELDDSESSKPGPMPAISDQTREQPVFNSSTQAGNPVQDAAGVYDSSPSKPGSLPFSPLDDEMIDNARGARKTGTSPAMKSDERGSRRTLTVGAFIAIAVAVMAALFAAGVFDGGGADADSTATAEARGTQTALAVAAAVTEEASATPTRTPSPVPPSPAAPTPVPTGPGDSAGGAGLPGDESGGSDESAEPSAEATDEPEPTATLTEEPEPTATLTEELEPTVTPTLEATPTLDLTAEPGEPEVLLRYDGRTLVLYNRDQSRINISGLVFVRVTAEGNETATFEAAEWESSALRALDSMECFQVWTIAYRSLPADEFPADICRTLGRQGFRQTSSAFWISSNPESVFEVRRGGSVLATCPTSRREAADELRCLVSLEG